MKPKPLQAAIYSHLLVASQPVFGPAPLPRRKRRGGLKLIFQLAGREGLLRFLPPPSSSLRVPGASTS